MEAGLIMNTMFYTLTGVGFTLTVLNTIILVIGLAKFTAQLDKIEKNVQEGEKE